MIACTIVANTGYLGYPLTAALLGLDEVGEAVAYDIGVSAPALLIGAFAVGAAFGTRAGSRRPRADRLVLRPQPAALRGGRGPVRPRRRSPPTCSSTSRGSSSSRSSPSASSRSAPRSPRRPTRGRCGSRRRSRGRPPASSGRSSCCCRRCSPARGAPDRPSRHLPADGADAERPELDDRRPRLRARPLDHGRGDHLDDRDRRRRRGGWSSACCEAGYGCAPASGGRSRRPRRSPGRRARTPS